MKTKFAIAAIALALTSASAFATDTTGTTGTVKFNGTVKAVSCDITVDNQDYNGAVINLNEVYKTDLSADKAVKTKQFDIAFKNCKVQFPGVSDTAVSGDSTVTVAWEKGGFGKNGYLENTLSSGAAENVYLALFNGTDVTKTKAIAPGEESGSVKQTFKNGEATFSYTVGYVTDDLEAVKPGSIASEAVYKLSYN